MLLRCREICATRKFVDVSYFFLSFSPAGIRENSQRRVGMRWLLPSILLRRDEMRRRNKFTTAEKYRAFVLLLPWLVRFVQPCKNWRESKRCILNWPIIIPGRETIGKFNTTFHTFLRIQFNSLLTETEIISHYIAI